ncbi:thioredoxin family protein [Paenibacillus methanolicus]|uniref:Thioredoxin n=1 Tax=Paenibacillus methanolicus TaxID=582686 RepID=A0A5S5BUB0_9BACL|nr:thioredoxin family protein [Paenibacillus methanolicus]TYP70554.1 thioredoxin [Paenibacillus methanolicus]
MKELAELTEKELLGRLAEPGNREAVLFFTPLCGTCKVAERMLQVVEASGKAIPLHKLNINYARELRQRWQIASVPCLVVVEAGEVQAREYAMHGVDFLFDLLKEA